MKRTVFDKTQETTHASPSSGSYPLIGCTFVVFSSKLSLTGSMSATCYANQTPRASVTKAKLSAKLLAASVMRVTAELM